MTRRAGPHRVLGSCPTCGTERVEVEMSTMRGALVACGCLRAFSRRDLVDYRGAPYCVSIACQCRPVARSPAGALTGRARWWLASPDADVAWSTEFTLCGGCYRRICDVVPRFISAAPSDVAAAVTT